MFSDWNDFGFDRTFAWMDEIRRRMDQTLEAQTNNNAWAWSQVGFRDEATALVFTAQLPGVSRDNLKVSLHNDTLTISGERGSDLPEGYTVHRRERAPFKCSR